jgi:hypothetical protein
VTCWREPDIEERLALDPDTVPASQIGTEEEAEAELARIGFTGIPKAGPGPSPDLEAGQ